MTEGIRPFQNGSEYAIWTGRNCDHCAKYNPDLLLDKSQCEIDKALVIAYFEDGTVSEEIWERMGKCSGRCKERIFLSGTPWVRRAIKVNWVDREERQ